VNDNVICEMNDENLIFRRLVEIEI